jgi:predicted AlkP superfamily phosphohydrolase/phosphomutase
MKLTSNPKKGEQYPLFRLVDWSKTQAYSVGFSGIYLNLENREGKGSIKIEDKEKVLSEIKEKLLNLKDENGNGVVHQVYFSSEIYSGEYAKDSPDLIIGFNPGFRAGWESPIGGTPLEVFNKNNKKWKGDHIVDSSFVPGVLFTNFDIKKEKPSVLDIAPTVLDIFNVNIASDIDGESLIIK